MVAVEDVDFTGCYTHPASPAYAAYCDLYTRAGCCARGGDPGIGPRLPAMFLAAGLTDIGMHVVQPVGTLGFDKRLDVPFGNGHRWSEVVPPGEQTAIALVSAGSGQQPGIRSQPPTPRPTTPTCGPTARTPTPSNPRGPARPPMFTVRDPDGNALPIVEGA